MPYEIDFINMIVSRAAKIATRAALNGNPLETITWVPPLSATQDRIGMFVLDYAELRTSDTPPWKS